MQFTLEQANGQVIHSYKPGEIRIGTRTFSDNLIVMPNNYAIWSIADAEVLTSDELLPLLDFKPDIVVIGTGERQIFPAIEAYAPLLQSGIGVEIMDSAAAARTYNVLVAEGRHVLAALIV